MATIALSGGVRVVAELNVRQSIVVKLTGLLAKRTLKWFKPHGNVLRYGIQWTRGRVHNPERTLSYVGNVLKFNVRKLPGMAGATGRYSFAVTAFGTNGRRIGDPGILENVRVT